MKYTSRSEVVVELPQIPLMRNFEGVVGDACVIKSIKIAIILGAGVGDKTDPCFGGIMFFTDVAVIGAGHAGIEAAMATSRMGLDTVLFTLCLDAVGNLPCNPSIGGTGKGHLVFEIDSLGGEMGVSADKVMIQNRTLNLGRGAAVHSKRIQADRRVYQDVMKKTIEKQSRLKLVQDEVASLIFDFDSHGNKIVTGIMTRLGLEWKAKAVIICTGTYLGGLIHVGEVNYSSGPDGMQAASHLTQSLLSNDVRLMRFKTGTPVRINKDTIDFTQLEIQHGEHPVIPFSILTDRDKMNSVEQIPCHIAYTNINTHQFIRKNLHFSPLYAGRIHGTGPRYCPSIEDKVVRFADKERHQLFVEPVGADTNEIYLQGFSTSLPAEIQYDMLHSLKGFEHAEIMRYAYAIEYDCCDPTQLYPTLEFKNIGGLYGAGQFNGSSGYEEAAAQGLIAGINAALRIKGEEPLILTRSSSYIGTLIDDLVTKGTNEPYRIMTSRSEYRLLLRQDNADVRLTEMGRKAGLVTDERYELFKQKREMVDSEVKRAWKLTIAPSVEINQILEESGTTPLSTGAKLADLLKRPQLGYEKFKEIPDIYPQDIPESIIETAEIEIKYDGYVNKQMAEVKRQSKLEDRALPENFDYAQIHGLRLEASQKLNKIKPKNIGQASRISGVSPADITVLLIYMENRE